MKVMLTPKGREAYKKHQEFHEKMVSAAIGNLSEVEKEMVLNALNNIEEYFIEEGKKMVLASEVQSICPVCHKPVNAEYVVENEQVIFKKTCDDHGDFASLVSEDSDAYLRWMEYRSISIPPKTPITKGKKDECPLHCGTCEEHLMTACCVLLDVTERCNQKCPYCFASANEDPSKDPSLSKIEHQYDRLIELGETRPFNIQLSGGEPTVRDDLHDIIRMGRSKGFEYIQLNTNGKRIAEEEGYARILKDAGVSTVFLQFDGTNDEIYEALRNEPLLDTKSKAIDECRKARIPVTLVPTIVKNVNLFNIGDMIRFMLQNLNVVKGIHFQPVSFFGRHPEVDFQNRVTMFRVMDEIEKQTGGIITKEDLVPISTGHQLCCFCANFLKERDGEIKSLMSEEQKAEGMDCCCGEPDPEEIVRKDRDFVLNKWEVSDSCCCSDAGDEPRSFDEALAYLRNNMFTISGMAFMDESNLDAERLKRCRVQVFTEDERLIPFCGYNSIYRK